MMRQRPTRAPLLPLARLALLAAVAGGCTVAGHAPVPPIARADIADEASHKHVVSAPPVADHVDVPMTLELAAPYSAPSPGERVRLELKLTRRGGWPGDVVLRADVPPGATLVEDGALEPMPDTGPGQTIRTLELQLGPTIPAQDLLVTAKLSGDGFGVTSRAYYRFGRPEPKLQRGDGRAVLGPPVGAMRSSQTPTDAHIQPPAAAPTFPLPSQMP